VIALDGRVAGQWHGAGTNMTMDLSPMASGSYMLVLDTQEGRRSWQFFR
jgi:hypothetical protein